MANMDAAQVNNFAESDQAALEWLASHADPGQFTKIAKGLKMILNESWHGEITMIIKNGQITGHPKVTISVS